MSTLARWENIGIPVGISSDEVRAWEVALKVPGGWLLRVGAPAPPRTSSATAGDRYLAAGQRARERRDFLAISRRTVSGVLGIRLSVLSAWENRGVSLSIKAAQVVAWEAVLEVEPGWLLGEVIDLTPDEEADQLISDAGHASQAIAEISAHLAGACRASIAKGNQATDAREETYAEMFSQRYGVDSRVGTTLKAIATHHGVSESRLCQIIGKLSAMANNLAIEAPVFARISAEAATVLPCVGADLEARIRPLLGDGLSVEDAARFALEVLRKPLFVFELARINGVRQKVVAAAHAPDSIRHVTTHEAPILNAARGMIRAVGVAHVGMIKTWAMEEGWAPEAVAQVQPIIELAKGFEWIEEPGSARSQWFTLSAFEQDRNLILDATRRVLSVARGPVDLDDIVEAVARLRMTRARHGILSNLFEVQAPRHIVLAFLRRQSWLAAGNSDNTVRSLKVLDPREVLSPTEVIVYEALNEFGGVAARRSLHKKLVVERGVEDASFTHALFTGPCITRLFRGVYAIRGVQPEPESLARAVQDSRKLTGAMLPQEVDEATGRVSFYSVLTGWSLDSSVWVPGVLEKHLPLRAFTVSPEGKNLRTELDRSNGRKKVIGFGPLVRSRGHGVGDTIKLTFDTRNGTLSIEHISDSHSDADARNGEAALEAL